MRSIIIRLADRQIAIAEGKPAIVVWKTKNKQRPGTATAVAWIKRGERPGELALIHSGFQTYDKVEQEYTSSWHIFERQLIDVRPLAVVRG